MYVYVGTDVWRLNEPLVPGLYLPFNLAGNPCTLSVLYNYNVYHA